MDLHALRPFVFVQEELNLGVQFLVVFKLPPGDGSQLGKAVCIP
jgi:hypothetical protein